MIFEYVSPAKFNLIQTVTTRTKNILKTFLEVE